jgi:NAD(P)-dependent dehydrogenase (short-subunit alcohol dehydrogenase family)
VQPRAGRYGPDMAIKDLRGRRVLITGAASGIGRATALRLVRERAQLVLTDINDDGLEQIVAEVRGRGGEVCAAAALDVADYDSVAAFAHDIHRDCGTVDVVMNIAGIATWGAVENLEHRHWRRTIDVDLMGPIHVIECFVPDMITAGRGGHLVNVSSAAGLFGLPWHGPYSAAKFGLRGVSEVLRFDLRRHGIGVTLVCPGAVRTGLVGTVNVVGVDRDRPGFQKLARRFEAHAVPPERAAERIVTAVKRGRYLVFTSADIQLTHWLQRKFEPVYVLAMRVINARFVSIARRLAAAPRDRSHATAGRDV